VNLIGTGTAYFSCTPLEHLVHPWFLWGLLSSTWFTPGFCGVSSRAPGSPLVFVGFPLEYLVHPWFLWGILLSTWFTPGFCGVCVAHRFSFLGCVVFFFVLFVVLLMLSLSLDYPVCCLTNVVIVSGLSCLLSY
jgi:hypothetical protein